METKATAFIWAIIPVIGGLFCFAFSLWVMSKVGSFIFFLL